MRENRICGRLQGETSEKGAKQTKKARAGRAGFFAVGSYLPHASGRGANQLLVLFLGLSRTRKAKQLLKMRPCKSPPLRLPNRG